MNMRPKSSETFKERLARHRREGFDDLRPDMTPAEVTAVIENREQPTNEEMAEGFLQMSPTEKVELADALGDVVATMRLTADEFKSVDVPEEKQKELDELIGQLHSAADGLHQSAAEVEALGTYEYISDCHRRRLQRRAPVPPGPRRLGRRNRQKRRRRSTKCASSSGGGDPPGGEPPSDDVEKPERAAGPQPTTSTGATPQGTTPSICTEAAPDA